MFYRLLGRIFFYFWVLPFVYNVLEPMLKSVIVDAITKQVTSSMTEEQKLEHARRRRYSHGALCKDAPPRPSRVRFTNS